MLLRPFFSILSFISIILLTAQPLSAQWYRIKGTVYDSSRNSPMQGVSVLSSSGRGTVTNANGYYEIEVTENDSIWFSYLTKPTIKFPVIKISNQLAFDISLQVNVPVLKEVRIRPPNYKLDSMRNREDYAKVFNYQKPKLKTELTPNGFGSGVGFDLDEIINMFRFKRNRSMMAFQKRLLAEEQDKFVDHRFSKSLIRRLTKLTGPELDSFIRIYRPSYLFAQLASDYDFQKYIKDAYTRFKKGLPPADPLKPPENDL